MRRLGLLSLVCKFLEVSMPCATLTPTRMYKTVDISIRFNKEHQARLCQPPPVSKWDPSPLSLQGWDSIPCQGGWRSWKRHWFTLPFFNVNATAQHCWFAMLWPLSVYITGFRYYISMWYVYGCLDFCHRTMSRVLSIRAFKIIYLRYTFLWIKRRKIGNFCGLSLWERDICV